MFSCCSPGGCAAQEAIKIITKQYVPLDNTFIYNAITATTATLRVWKCYQCSLKLKKTRVHSFSQFSPNLCYISMVTATLKYIICWLYGEIYLRKDFSRCLFSFAWIRYRVWFLSSGDLAVTIDTINVTLCENVIN